MMISQSDRRVEIETGYGLTKILPDAKIKNLIDKQIIPQFKNKNFDQGALDGVKALIIVLDPSQPDSPSEAQPYQLLIDIGLTTVTQNLPKSF